MGDREAMDGRKGVSMASVLSERRTLGAPGESGEVGSSSTGIELANGERLVSDARGRVTSSDIESRDTSRPVTSAMSSDDLAIFPWAIVSMSAPMTPTFGQRSAGSTES